MPSEAATTGTSQRRLEVLTTRQTEFIDLTNRLEALVAEAGVRDGVLHVHTRHTTTGLLINEAEPLLMQDLEGRFARWAPDDHPYAHDDPARRTVNLGEHERRNGFAHCRAALLRTSETIIVAHGRLSLGRWQRVMLVEFDGPQRREVAALLVPAP